MRRADEALFRDASPSKRFYNHAQMRKMRRSEKQQIGAGRRRFAAYQADESLQHGR